MAAILLVAHAPLASALKAVASHAYPDCSGQLAAVDVAAQMTADEAEAAVRAALEQFGQGEVLMLVDVVGASPCNAALRAAAGRRVRVVAGVNVPMLWRSLCYTAEPLDRLATRAVDGVVQGAQLIPVSIPQNQPSAPSSHDQEQHKHQQ